MTTLLLAYTMLQFSPGQASDALPRRGTLGASISGLTPEQTSAAKLQPGEGLAIVNPLPGLTADVAGMKAGDIITAINGKPVRAQGLSEALRTLPAGQSVRFSVKRGSEMLQLEAKFTEKPRDPGGPNYTVEYRHIVSNGQKMRTIITLPKKPGKHPGFFFIQGFSPVSYDYRLDTADGSVASINGPLLFDFANRNFVTIRVEKPGVGDSEGGPFADMDYTTELDIYRQTLKQLKSIATVDTDNIFIFGHSMGSAFGPMVAAENPVKGIVTYGAAARNWFEYLIDVVRYQPLVGGAKYEEADETVRQVSRLMALVFLERKSVAEVKKSHPQLAPYADIYLPNGQFSGKTLEFWRQLNDTNFPSYWVKSGAHVLAVKGASDFVVYEADHKLIADAVNQAKPGYGKWAIAPNSDHLFHEFATEPESQKNFQKGKFSMVFAKMMREWIEEVMAKTKP